MSESNPYRLLGIADDANFDEVQEARTRLLTEFATDDKQQQLIEMAYDNILMQRLKLRQDGKIKVPERIRYPERIVFTRPAQQAPTRPNRQWWRNLPINFSDSGLSALVFTATWLLYLALSTASQTDTSYAVALGLFATIYFLFRKIRVFWKAVLYSLGAVVAAILASASLEQLVAGQVSGGFTGGILFVILWLATVLLR